MLKQIPVSNAMTKNVKTLSIEMSILQALMETLKTTHNGFPVVENDKVIFGFFAWLLVMSLSSKTKRQERVNKKVGAYLWKILKN